MAVRAYDSDANGSGIVEQYYLQDANMNVVAVLDDSGDVEERYQYSSYGSLTVLDDTFTPISSSAIANPYTYSGRRFDSETGLYQYRNRYYHAQLGRFVSRDPIGYEGSEWNLYEYVGGMAVGRLDPYGLRDAGGWWESTRYFFESTWTGTKDASVGFFYDAPKEVVVGTYDAVSNPVQTVQGLSHAVQHPIQTADAIVDDFVESASSDRGRGKLGGELIGTLIGGHLSKAKFCKKLPDAPNGKAFTVDPRVVGQLSDSRLGSLAGKITPERLHELVNNNAARRFFDTRTGNINVIQEIEGKLVRITVAGDKFMIISVGPIRERNILNLIKNGGFVPQ